MKNILLFQIIFVFILSACSDFSGNEDGVEASLNPAPILNEVTAVTTPTTDTTPNYTFSSSEAGTITYGGSCSSSKKNAISGNNTITLRTLSDGTYSNCTITVTNTLGNSATLIISTFVVDSPTLLIYYDLKGITFGNNTFVTVGEKGTVRYSSDNGSSWDNGTSGRTSEFKEIAFGSNSFVAVGYRGTHSYSSDNGTSWDNGTWSDFDSLTGVAYGNNTFIGVSSTNLTRSTDSGSNWNKIGAGLKVIDVAFGNSKFVACGAEGAVVISSDNGGSWTTYGNSGVSAYTLNGITFGNNQFFAVGNSGQLIKSVDNASSWSSVDSTVTKKLNSIVFGNNTFVGVGYRTVIVSTDNGSTFTIKEDTLTFNDVTYGNGVFAAVGDDEIIYTSTDGDTWTKVHGK